jgi:hypothetical protein
MYCGQNRCNPCGRRVNVIGAEIVGSTILFVYLRSRESSRGVRYKKMINKYDCRSSEACVRVRKRAPAFCQRRALIPSYTPPFRVSTFSPSVPSCVLSSSRSIYSTRTHLYISAHARICVLSTRKSCVYHSTAVFSTLPLSLSLSLFYLTLLTHHLFVR